MARIALFLFALFASVLLALASPVPVANGGILDIERRVTRTGRVRFSFFELLLCLTIDEHFAHHRELGFTLVSTLLCCTPFITDRLLGKGNCGKINRDGDLILAIGKQLYDRNRGSNCDQVGLLINIHNVSF